MSSSTLAVAMQIAGTTITVSNVDMNGDQMSKVDLHSGALLQNLNLHLRSLTPPNHSTPNHSLSSPQSEYA